MVFMAEDWEGLVSKGGGNKRSPGVSVSSSVKYLYADSATFNNPPMLSCCRGPERIYSSFRSVKIDRNVKKKSRRSPCRSFTNSVKSIGGLSRSLIPPRQQRDK